MKRMTAIKLETVSFKYLSNKTFSEVEIKFKVKSKEQGSPYKNNKHPWNFKGF